MTHIAALTSGAGWTSGMRAALRGGGVIGTGTLVPDAMMDNNALYLSSNASGAPSIKVGGSGEAADAGVAQAQRLRHNSGLATEEGWWNCNE